MVGAILKGNFRGWGNSQVSGTTIGRLTPHQVLARGKQLSLSVGKNYYQGLRSQLSDLSAPTKPVLAKGKDEEVNASLREALLELLGHR